ncbi:protein turtle homolog B-like [Centruroides vittatus]|uniref:protein turtle homolog B-like n=1 Tax=Centruroides vittatus TaxID=120091 RepID=UPI00351088B5
MELSCTVAWFTLFITFNQLGIWMAKVTDQETFRPSTIFAVAGKTVAIPCDAHPSAKGDSVALILWYKDNITTPMYSLDARQGNLNQARHAAKDVLTTRAFLNILTEPAVLQLNPVLVADEGEYKCRADFRNERTRYSSVTLKVFVEPEKPVIKDSFGEIQQSLIGPYNEGDALVLICEVTGGKPLPSLTWWRENVLLDDTYHIVSSNFVMNELEISALQRHDLMAVFTCKAINNNITAPLVSSVTIDMNFRPLDVQIEGERKPMASMKQVELNCRAIGSRPPALITWWLGKNKLKSVKDIVSVDGNITTSVLSFRPSREDSGRYLSCRAQNTLIADSTIEHGWNLDVYYAPQVTLRLSSKLRHSPIQEGSDVYLECVVHANPPATNIDWKFDERQLQTNRTAGIIITNQSLILQKVHKSSKGQYTCIATNSEGRVESNPVMLRIQYSPVCAHQEKIVYSGGKNEPVRVACEVYADPEPLAFRWKVNTSVDTGQMMTMANQEARNVATYIPKSDEEFGTIECWAKNSVGEQTIPCTYIILPAGPPEKPKSCSVSNQTETSFVVHCIEGYSGGVSQHFVLEVYSTVIKTLQNNQTSDVPIFTVTDLEPGGNFQVFIYSSNSIGRSSIIVLNTSTLPSPSSLTRTDDDWKINFPPIFLVLTIVSVGLTSSIFLTIVIVKIRNRSRNRRNVPSAAMDDKCQTPLRKDTDDEWKSCAYVGDGKGPDIIPEIRESGFSEDMMSEGVAFQTGSQKETDQINCKMKSANITLLQSSPTYRSRTMEHTSLHSYCSSPTKKFTNVTPTFTSKQTKV